MFVPNWLRDFFVVKGPSNPLSTASIEGIPAYFNAMRVIPEAFSKLKVEVVTRDNQPIADHWVADLWNYKCNSFQDPNVVKRSLCRDFLRHGEGFCEIDLKAREVYYVPHYSMEVQVQSKKTVYRITRDTGPDVLPAEKILHFIAIPDESGRRGIGIIGKARQQLETAAEMQRYENSLWRNVVKPFVVVKAKGELKPEAKKNWKEYFKKKTEGTANVGGGLLLENDDDVEFINHSPADMEFIEAQRFSVEQIARLFCCPPPYLQDLTQVNWSILSELSSVFADQTIAPHCQVVEEQCENKLFGKDEPFQVRFKLSDLQKGSWDKAAAATAQLAAAAVVTTNEQRDRLDLPPTGNPKDNEIIRPLNVQQGDVGGKPE